MLSRASCAQATAPTSQCAAQLPCSTLPHPARTVALAAQHNMLQHIATQHNMLQHSNCAPCSALLHWSRRLPPPCCHTILPRFSIPSPPSSASSNLVASIRAVTSVSRYRYFDRRYPYFTSPVLSAGDLLGVQEPLKRLPVGSASVQHCVGHEAGAVHDDLPKPMSTQALSASAPRE